MGASSVPVRVLAASNERDDVVDSRRLWMKVVYVAAALSTADVTAPAVALKQHRRVNFFNKRFRQHCAPLGHLALVLARVCFALTLDSDEAFVAVDALGVLCQKLAVAAAAGLTLWLTLRVRHLDNPLVLFSWLDNSKLQFFVARQSATAR